MLENSRRTVLKIKNKYLGIFFLVHLKPSHVLDLKILPKVLLLLLSTQNSNRVGISAPSLLERFSNSWALWITRGPGVYEN